MDQFLKKVCTFLIMEIIYIGLISWGILLVPSWFERGDLRFEKLSDNKKPSRPPSIIRTFWWGHKSENSCRVITRLIFSTTASKCIWRIIYEAKYLIFVSGWGTQYFFRSLLSSFQLYEAMAGALLAAVYGAQSRAPHSPRRDQYLIRYLRLPR